MPAIKKLFKKQKKKPALPFDELKKRLRKQRKRSILDFHKKHRRSVAWLRDRDLSLSDLRKHGYRTLAASTIIGTLLLGTGAIGVRAVLPPQAKTAIGRIFGAVKSVGAQTSEFSSLIKKNLRSVLPRTVRPLTDEEAEQVSEIASNILGVKAAAVLEGNKLNTCYGYIGGEQHLYRYPGDTLEQHFETPEEAAMFAPSGIAPGLGAWGYFADSKMNMNPETAAKERYYAAAQTFLIRDWNTNQPYLRDWYKHRKVLLINPKTGQAVCAVLGDSGPATWTGKQFGGSPEVMHHLGLGEGPREGAVLMLFLDDPENKVPLGPIQAPLHEARFVA